jgi:hypothetical protein
MQLGCNYCICDFLVRLEGAAHAAVTLRLEDFSEELEIYGLSETLCRGLPRELVGLLSVMGYGITE